jgi:hypothetical protein
MSDLHRDFKILQGLNETLRNNLLSTEFKEYLEEQRQNFHISIDFMKEALRGFPQGTCRGQKINLLKWIREKTGLPLKEAKEFIEEIFPDS